MKIKDPSSTPKEKKPVTKRWWFWAIIFIVACCVIAPFLPNSEPKDAAGSPAPSVSQEPSESPAESSDPVEATLAPEEIEAAKAIAKDLDAQILSICSAAENDYKVFIDLMSADGTSDLDMYNTAKTLKENLKVYNYSQLSDIKGDGIDDYKQSASMYIFMMSEVADKTMDYLDDPITSKLSKVQEAVEGVSPYMYTLAADRITYLYAAGFTDEEVQEITAVTSE